MLKKISYFLFPLMIALLECTSANANSCLTGSDLLASVSPDGGDKTGNGGRGGVIQFKWLAQVVLSWTERTQLDKIETFELDKAALISRLMHQKWRVCFNDEAAVYVHGKPRTCRNSFDPTDPSLIECSNSAFNAESPAAQYLTVYHELLGRAGAEPDINGESSDRISRQMMPYLKSVRTVVLADDIQLPGKSDLDVEDVTLDKLTDLTGMVSIHHDMRVTESEDWSRRIIKVNGRCIIHGNGLPRVGRVLQQGDYEILEISAEAQTSWGDPGYAMFELEGDIQMMCIRGQYGPPTVAKMRKMLGKDASFSLWEEGTR